MKAWSAVLAVLAITALVYDLNLASWTRIPLVAVIAHGSIPIDMNLPVLLLAGLAVIAAAAVQLAAGHKAGGRPPSWP